ncbi:DUF2125 domain-containing protein [Sulfitobacter mediterraneus]|uniref:DUF2125 domain-containing protein n=1 Tax=Sulfitobacter mediterraneus TaxID=83219 RepID=A0A2T6CFN0_9RHOB|nr:DUF2125 domain-containing protein [Sulfitobacter mediterraneus]KIN77707.1 DUF2125 domain containing protein [Sulfitobacter mediterraneus KCTC 32188]PTX74315.1 hypothetical protein C8N31_104196 [Sulfitobacter mediterraneus]
MHIMIRLLILLAVIWSGWWWLAATFIDRGADGWLAARRGEGWQAQVQPIATKGFPSKFQTQITDLSLADPEKGVALRLDSATVSAPAYWPGYVTLALPSSPIELDIAAITHLFRVQNGTARLHLHPGASLQLDHMQTRGGAWQWNTRQGNALAGDDWAMQVAQNPAVIEKYQFDLQITNLRPGEQLRTLLSVPSDWPLSFEHFSADLAVTFDRPWDRRAVEDQRPQPRRITLQDAKASWGPIRLVANGDLIVDDMGIPEGAANLLVENWTELLELAVAGGALPANIRPQAQAMLGALANMGGDPTRLDLSLRFAAGEMYLGPIRLGPAPRIVLR